MKWQLAALAFLFTLLALAGAANAASSNSSAMTITISKPDDTNTYSGSYVVLPSTPAKKEAKVNFSYIASTENNITWCMLIVNNVQTALKISVDKDAASSFNEIAFRNGTWWYYIQCRDNYTRVFNSTNKTLTVALDDTPPVVTTENTPDYNTTTGRTVLRFIAVDASTPIRNCSLYVDGAYQGSATTVTNNTIVSFPELYYPGGDYTWKVYCTDDAGNTGKSTHGSLVAEMTTTQVITQVAPARDAVDFDGYVTFKYNPISRLPIKWCALRLNETYNASSNNIINNTENTFNNTKIEHGPFNWSVTCSDSAGNNVTSDMWGITINLTRLVSEYLKITLSSPEDYYITEKTSVDFSYAPMSYFKLARCELITNKSIREVEPNPASGSQANFSNVSLSEGMWEWRVRCIDESDNDYNSDLRTLIIKPIKPEPIPDSPDKPISPKVPEVNVSQVIENITGQTTGLFGVSNAMWVTLVIAFLMFGTGLCVIIVDRRFELELRKDLQMILYKAKLRKKPPELKKNQLLTEEHKKALKEYIMAHMKNGVPRQKIEETLRAYKWSDAHVKQVFEELEWEWEEWRQKYAEKK